VRNNEVNISRRECPKAILNVTGFKGRKITVVLANDVFVHGFYWDGGSKTEWTMFNLATGEHREMSARASAPFNFGGAMEATYPIPEGWVVVEDRIFCGKRMGLRIHARAPLAIPA
jgi:hypothetical protein